MKQKKIQCPIPRTSKNKPLIIAGNGPSLARIDYARMPIGADVFRCNQFYFEPKYFLGNSCEAVFFNGFSDVFERQYYTAKCLIQRDEYKIKNIIVSNFGFETSPIFEHFHAYFPDAKLGYDYFKKLKAFDCFFKFNEHYRFNRITSGVYMVAVGVAMGYDEFYIAGIDFYEKVDESDEVGDYAFDTHKPNLIKILPSFAKRQTQGGFHKGEFEVQALNFLRENYGVKIYSLSSVSPLSKHFPLAPINKTAPHFTVLTKKPGYTDDILITPMYFRKKPDMHHILDILYDIRRKVDRLNKFDKNIYFVLWHDFWRLPLDILRHLRERFFIKKG